MKVKTEHSGKLNIEEIAKIANVSIASVSRAINNKSGISEKTRERILKICRELEYVPSTSARELMGNYKNTIAISVGSHEFYPSRYLGMLWPALAATIRNSGRNLLPISFEAFDLNSVGAVILLGVEEDDGRIEACKEKNIPFVCIGMQEGEFWVAPNDFLGTREATNYLIEKGLQKIAFVTPTIKGSGYLHRYQGYLSAMGSGGLEVKHVLTGSRPLTEIAAYRMFTRMTLAELKNIEAFICQCDETALGVIAALEDRGFKIPDDYHVIGYDGLPSISDDITTVVQDVKLISEHVAQLLEKAINFESPVGSIVPVNLRKGFTA